MLNIIFLEVLRRAHIFYFILFLCLFFLPAESFCGNEVPTDPCGHGSCNKVETNVDANVKFGGYGNNSPVDASNSFNATFGWNNNVSQPPLRPQHCEGEGWQKMCSSLSGVLDMCTATARTTGQKLNCFYDYNESVRGLLESCKADATVQSNPKT